jgi:hypothetical protein
MPFAQKDIIFKIQFAHLVTPQAVYLVHHLNVQKAIILKIQIAHSLSQLVVYLVHQDALKDIKPLPGSPRVPRDITGVTTADVQKDIEAQLMASVQKGSSHPNKVAAHTAISDQLTPFVRSVIRPHHHHHRQ